MILSHSIDTQSNGKPSYVSVIPAVDSIDIKHSLHLQYELLPPHPPFVTSVCLKLPNVILLNSGDMLFAILLSDNRLLNDQVDLATTINEPVSDSIRCYCGKFGKIAECKQTCEENVSVESSSVCDAIGSDKNGHNGIEHSAVKHEEAFNESELICQSKLDVLNNIDSTKCNSEYVSFVMQRYSLLEGEESQESLPASPFDCTATVMPCRVTSFDGVDTLKHTYEHRCFRNNDKGM